MKSTILTLALSTALANPTMPTASPDVAAVHPAAPWASLIVPGAGQMLAGDTTEGLLWLGGGLAAGAGTYAFLRGQMPADALVTPDTPQFYFLGLLAYAAWLGVGAAATAFGLARAAARTPRTAPPTPAPAASTAPAPGTQRPVETTPPRKPRRVRPRGED
ncbi:MAG: hypothetical protein VKO64_01560 [Candidatus Sericytochromatia bacterium]|nr:hypothetical protein [Candidatus Sericytochromatia bacterium]